MSEPEIHLPDPCLVVMVGAAGSGKSTFCAKHFAETEVVSSDHCRALICDDPTNQEVSQQAFALLRQIAALRLHNHRLTVVDATSVEREHREDLVRLARETMTPAVAIVLNLPEKTCLERNLARDRAVPTEAISEHVRILRASLPDIGQEGFAQVVQLESSHEARSVRITRETSLEAVS